MKSRASRFRRPGRSGIGFLVALLAVSGAVFASVAFAAIGGGNSAGVVSDAPDPTAAFIEEVTGPGTGPTVVIVCFDERLTAGSTDPTRFWLRGYDEDQPPGGSDITEGLNPDAAEVASDSRCTGGALGHAVRLTFDTTENIEAYSMVEINTVLPGTQPPPNTPAVRDLENNPNSPGFLELEGTNVEPGPGFVSGPNFISLTRDPASGIPGQGGTGTYCFDRRVDLTGAGPEFGFYTDQGTRITGLTAETAGAFCIRVQFPAPGGTNVGQGVRFFVEHGAVDVQGPRDDPNALDVAGEGTEAPPETTQIPDLLTAQLVPGTEATFRLTYDDPVNPNDATLCQAYYDDASTETGANLRNAPDDINSLLVDFPGVDINLAALEIVKVVDEGGCAQSTATGSILSSTGEANILSNPEIGFSSGPDLQGCTLDPQNAIVTYTFDELLRESPPAIATRFGVVSQGGSFALGLTAVASENRAQVQFNPGVFNQVTVGCFVEKAAVQDRQTTESEDNPKGAVAAGSQPPTTSTTTSTTTTTTSPPPTTATTGPPPPGTTTTTTGGPIRPGFPGGPAPLRATSPRPRVRSIVDGGTIVGSAVVASSSKAQAAAILRGGVVSTLASGRISVPNRQGFSLNQICGGRVRLQVRRSRRGRKVADRRTAVSRRTCRWSKRFKFPARRLTRRQRTALGNGRRVRLYLRWRFGAAVSLRGTRFRTRSYTTFRRRGR